MKKFGKKRKISIFIGSSTESLSAAKALKMLFDEKIFMVNIWDEGVFEKGKSNIDNLLKFTDTYDYAIFIFVPDDEIVTRKNKKMATRHNVVFEFGLFLGRIGSKKTFIVAEESIKVFIKDVFTDLQGVSLGYTFKFDYKRIHDEGIEDELKSSLLESVVEIKSMIKKTNESLQLGFLPSTGIAIAYFENFISQIYTQIQNLRTGATSGYEKLKFGELIIDIYQQNFEIFIVIPNTLSEVSHKNLGSNLLDLNLVYGMLKTPSRPFTVYYKENLSEEIVNTHGLQLFDIPTGLSASLTAIRLLSNEQALEQLMAEKEIANFVKALEILLKSDKRMERHVKIISFEKLKRGILKI